MTRRLPILIPILGSLLLAPTAYAELYIYTDANGITHFTNIPKNDTSRS